MAELEEDFDLFFEDESVLSAVAAVENQHMKQKFSNDGTRGQDFVSKRKEEWEERINYHSYQSHQECFSHTDGLSVDKRRRIIDDREYSSPTNFGERGSGPSFDSKSEGEYMAALRGSNSEMWLKATQKKAPAGNSCRGGDSGYATNASGTAGGRGGPSGTCYKCGLEGHWARDCPKPSVAGGFAVQGGGPLPEPSDVPERNCPCGAGACIVLTASTEKNLGRRFYKCPLKRDEGQCTFFEWCNGGGAGGGESFTTDRTSKPDIPQVECKCGGGPCVTLTAKTERNNGRAFYKCPLPKEQACGFFQWCDEAALNDSSRLSTAVSSKSFTSSESPAAGACYKCGLGGHWARDCTIQSSGGFGNSNAYASGSKKDFSSVGAEQNPVAGSCFKCGQGGHWARDCPNEGCGSGLSGDQAYNSTRTAEVKNTQPCYKCGRQGHWSSSCPSSGGGVLGGPKQFDSGGQPPGGSCYKCGNSGHWANRCPVASGGQR